MNWLDEVNEDDNDLVEEAVIITDSIEQLGARQKTSSSITSATCTLIDSNGGASAPEGSVSSGPKSSGSEMSLATVSAPKTV